MKYLAQGPIKPNRVLLDGRTGLYIYVLQRLTLGLPSMAPLFSPIFFSDLNLDTSLFTEITDGKSQLESWRKN